MKKLFLFIFALLLTQVSAHAASGGNPCANKKIANTACLQICNACQQAGFIVGEAKVGDGFWRDCVYPLMTGSAEPQKAVKAGHPLPAGTWAPVASQCQSAVPGWGLPKGKNSAPAAASH